MFLTSFGGESGACETIPSLNNLLENEDTKKLIQTVYRNILETMPVDDNKLSKRETRPDLWNFCNYSCYKEPWYYILTCEAQKYTYDGLALLRRLIALSRFDRAVYHKPCDSWANKGYMELCDV
ncbi:hypothetical protein PIROE2DRAFT_10022 [Piromyces sp. E2]|nr:hypothetical protein PIROE2DRAFT_10022 [Piromyces sp. E2]|eukprot:OUM63424.1 hypothetical protein PIROE2DRAFT_10022 [Piromyces sp. E2]